MDLLTSDVQSSEDDIEANRMNTATMSSPNGNEQSFETASATERVSDIGIPSSAFENEKKDGDTADMDYMLYGEGKLGPTHPTQHTHESLQVKPFSATAHSNSTGNGFTAGQPFSIRQHLIQAWITHTQSQPLEDSTEEISLEDVQSTLQSSSTTQANHSTSVTTIHKTKSMDATNSQKPLLHHSIRDISQKLANKLSTSFYSLANEDSTEMVTDKFPTRYSTQFFILLDRALKNARAGDMTVMRWVETVGMTLICGLIWFQVNEMK